MTEKNWDSWKDYDNYIERSIYLHEAEKEQLSIVEKEVGLLSSILFRGEYVGSLSAGYNAYLRLGDHRPILNIQAPDGKYVGSFILSTKGREEQ